MDVDTSLFTNSIGIALLALFILIAIISIISTWKLFEKAGLAGWKAIIPLYNGYCLSNIVFGNGWFFLAVLIPVPFVAGIYFVILQFRLVTVFGKGVGYGVLMVLFPGIMLPVLAFSNAEYVGVEPTKVF